MWDGAGGGRVGKGQVLGDCGYGVAVGDCGYSSGVVFGLGDLDDHGGGDSAGSFGGRAAAVGCGEAAESAQIQGEFCSDIREWVEGRHDCAGMWAEFGSGRIGGARVAKVDEAVGETSVSVEATDRGGWDAENSLE